MDDFDALLAGIKQRHMRLIIDLVVNHTTDEHQWFVESRKSQRQSVPRLLHLASRQAPAPTAPALPPNNYPSFFSGSAWTAGPEDQRVLPSLLRRQAARPQLGNPKVREEVYYLMRFWLDKGVAGFRMDVIPLISKTHGLPDLTPEQLKTPPTPTPTAPTCTNTSRR